MPKRTYSTSNDTCTKNPAAPVKEPATDQVATCLEKLTQIADCHKKAIDNHEQRIKALEEAMPKKLGAAKECSDKTETKTETCTETKSAKTKSAATKSTSKSAAASQTQEAECKDARVASWVKNGPGYAYRYWDATTRTYGLTRDIWAAKQISNGLYDPIWVLYRDGEIDHLLDKDEIKKYAP